MHYYHAFDLNLQSVIYFPELLERHDSFDNDVDVRICYGDFSPEGLASPTIYAWFGEGQITVSIMWKNCKSGQDGQNYPAKCGFSIG